MNNTEISNNAITWIDRLLVTRFKQGKKHLGNKVSGFCCLGLGCYINEIHYHPGFGTNDEFAAAVGLISRAGLHQEDIDFNNDSPRALTNLNDNGESFNFIAKAMKAEPEAYFTPEVAKIITEHYGE